MDERESKERLSDDIAEAIEFYEFSIENGPGKVPYAFIDHTNDIVMDARDKIHDSGYDKDKRIVGLDKKIIRLLKMDYPVFYKSSEQKGKDLKRWWWHLDKIQEGAYPPELLPNYLREEYFKLHPHLKQL